MKVGPEQWSGLTVGSSDSRWVKVRQVGPQILWARLEVLGP